MRKTRSLRKSVIVVYILSLILFVGIIIGFTIVFQQSYVDGKVTQARVYLASEDIILKDAVYELKSDGYDLSFQGENIDIKSVQEEVLLNEPVKTVVFTESEESGYGKIVINGIVEANVNETLITEFASELYVVIIATVLIYIGVTLVFVQYFVFQIINPLTKLNDELRRISEFDFDGARLDFKCHEEIQMLMRSVENIKLSLKSYNRNRTSLVSALVHELKSPVATISSVIQLNKMKHEKYNDEVTVQIIEESIESISAITKMSLEIFEKQTIYKIAKFDMVSFISEQLLLVKPKLDEKALNIEIDSEETVWNIDEESFSLIISNLLNNVYNYSQENTTVEISISQDMISLTNVVAEEFTSGTGKGLKIISSLLKDMNMELEYFEKDGKYFVIIRKS